MAFTDYGYDLLRNLLVPQITHVSIHDSAGAEIARLPLSEKITAVNDNTINKITVQAILQSNGTQAGIEIGAEAKEMRIYDSLESVTPIDVEVYASTFVFSGPEDQLIFKAYINATV